MLGNVVASRRFSAEDQQRFADLSGDHNEVHMDPVAARRTLAGRPVVHGVHLALWALEAFLANRPTAIARLTVTFPKPIYLNEDLVLEIVDDGDSTARLKILVDQVTAANVRLEIGSSDGTGLDERGQVELPLSPEELTLDDVRGGSGRLLVPADDGQWEELFPHLVASLGAAYPAQLATVSRLVGMVCPGRHSMLSGFDLSTDPAGSSASFDWEVIVADDRVGATRMTISGGRVKGSVDAFVRPTPTSQPTYRELNSLASPGEFAQQTALVVGGSRGLGEVTAKLVAAGGGDVVLTWHQGEEDAERVVTDITSGGGKASSLCLDISNPRPALAELARSGWQASHVYYFASPRISVRRAGFLDHRLLDQFIAAYVTGFADVVEACRLAGSARVRAFYPSSVFVTETDSTLIEYATAKAAGEVAAHSLATSTSWLTVLVQRLPRLATDQTASVLPVSADDPAPVVLDVIRRMVTGADVHSSG